MSKYKKWIMVLFIIVVFIPAIPCEAKVEVTNEIYLIDMGHGIWVPSSFDVIDANGNYATISKMDPSLCEEKEIDEESYCIILDNGYRAEKKWVYLANGKGYPSTVIYDENGETVFSLGCDINSKMQFSMKDKEGNYVQNTYTRSVMVDSKNDIFEQTGIKDETGTAYQVLTRVTYNEDEEVRREYKKWGDMLQLDKKYDYSEEGNETCTIYGKVNTMYGGNNYDQEEEYYASYSYKKADIQVYRPRVVVHVIGQGIDEYSMEPVELPSKITIRGEELYIYWLENYFADANWDESSKDMVDILAGRPIDQHFYFTKEQIEIMEAEGITTVEELQDKYPEFFETATGFVDTYVGTQDDTETEEEKKEREAKEAITTTEAETETESDGFGEWYNLPDGSREYWQHLTGDVVSIDGKTPVIAVSQETVIPGGGVQKSVVLYDSNYSIVMNFLVFDMEHTNYTYAYLTNVDLAINTAEIRGTNEPIGGNLGYVGEFTYDSYDEQITGSVYNEYYSPDVEY